MFAETLAKMLACCPDLQVCGYAPTFKAARRAIQTSKPDAIIVAGVHAPPQAALTHFITRYPGMAVVYTDLCTNDIQVVFSQKIALGSFDDLLAVLNTLPQSDP